MNQQDKQDILTEISMTIDMKKDWIRIHKTHCTHSAIPGEFSSWCIHPNQRSLYDARRKVSPLGRKRKLCLTSREIRELSSYTAKN